jgi:hypothetical protein
MERVIGQPIRGETCGIRGLCPGSHDLLIAKYAAGRDTDRGFPRELGNSGTRELAVLSRAIV